MNGTISWLQVLAERMQPALGAVGGRAAALSLAVALVASPAALAAEARFDDPLEHPAALLDLSRLDMVLSVERVGDALLAVGAHGLIMRSADGGGSWTQIASPVSSDLVQVRFSDQRHGWIVGHDSVVLHSSDGGLSWQRQLDGRELLSLLSRFYGERAQAGNEQAEALLDEIAFAVNTSADSKVIPTPFLDVFFNTEGEGFVIGAFGMILHSKNHGASWEPWLERTENHERMHLYGIDGRGERIFISGEQGLVMRLDREAGRFVAVETPYEGTLFGIRVLDDLLLTYGLRGNVLASRDEGLQWSQLSTGRAASVVSALELSAGKMLLVGQDGQMFRLDRATLSLEMLPVRQSGGVLAASLAHTGKLLLAGLGGIRTVHVTEVTD